MARGWSSSADLTRIFTCDYSFLQPVNADVMDLEVILKLKQIRMKSVICHTGFWWGYQSAGGSEVLVSVAEVLINLILSAGESTATLLLEDSPGDSEGIHDEGCTFAGSLHAPLSAYFLRCCRALPGQVYPPSLPA